MSSCFAPSLVQELGMRQSGLVMPSSRITQIGSSAQSAPMSTTGGLWARHLPNLVYVLLMSRDRVDI